MLLLSPKKQQAFCYWLWLMANKNKHQFFSAKRSIVTNPKLSKNHIST